MKVIGAGFGRTGTLSIKYALEELGFDPCYHMRTEVQRIVPADKLLVFNVKNGWQPLCNFLQLPIPDKPFPHANERAQMQTNLRIVRFVSRAIPTSIVALTAVLFWKLLKRMYA